jgi:tRNA dimethylallyltransferase
MKNKIVIIVGPTGSGKTSLAVKLAKAINGELINADAYQVYQEISVGTAKPSLSELQDISIHLNGTVSIFED